ncbi:MAG: tRNA (adenosine(37)-N6)-threonylcarbamoyltransferase complex transferase subunit TsaD [Candidatus Moraniibacteriota bacterium]
MHILSIETSCDDTAAAIIEWNPSSPSADGFAKASGQATVLANTVSSQIALHAQWGGVVPALASREHMKNIVPVIEETLAQSNMRAADIDLIAVTEGPGLMPALIVGISAAKTLALVWQKPLIGIQHLEGHIYANFIGNHQAPNSKIQTNPNAPIHNSEIQSLELDSELSLQNSTFPLIALIVSGGHTQLVLMQKHFDYTLLGETQDDAAGEAFDKVARLLGLPYPGGPVIAEKADAFRNNNHQEPKSNHQEITNFQFPRPMINSDDFNFSFSGLKTSVLYFLKKHEIEMKNERFIAMVCHEFQEAVVDVLVAKTAKALALYAPPTFVIAGGVSANVRLRERLATLIQSDFPITRFRTPEFAYSLDNAAMIGIAAAMRYEHMDEKQRAALMDTPLTLDPDANLPLQNLQS